MAAQWFLFYAMVATNLTGGGGALLWGRAVHRWIAAVFVLGIGVQVLCWRLAVACGISRPDAMVTIDMIDNVVMCAGFLILAMRYDRADWILLIMVLQATQLGFDGFVFQDDRDRTRFEFPDAANMLNIAEMTVLG